MTDLGLFWLGNLGQHGILASSSSCCFACLAQDTSAGSYLLYCLLLDRSDCGLSCIGLDGKGMASCCLTSLVGLPLGSSQEEELWPIWDPVVVLLDQQGLSGLLGDGQSCSNQSQPL